MYINIIYKYYICNTNIYIYICLYIYIYMHMFIHMMFTTDRFFEVA